MHARQPILTRFLMILAGALLATAVAACGGGGYGGGGGGGGGMSCGGAYGGACPPPTVSITAPTAGMTVSGTVALTATATAAAQFSLTIQSVQFFVDGTSQGTATASPYTVNWNAAAATNGSHSITAKATDSMNASTTSAAVMVTVTGGVFAAAMAASQISPMLSSKASGMARIGVDSETGAVSGTVSLSGMTARAVTINHGFAGSTGEAVITLAPRAGSTGEFVVPANVALSAEQRGALAQGRLYVVATSVANPNGEIRGQLVPDSVRVTFSELSASPEAAALGLRASGVAATTVDTRAGTLTVHVSSSGVDDATAARVNGAAGTQLAALARDRVDVSHFSTELARISAAEVESFEAGKLSVSVAGAATPEGAIRGLIKPDGAARGE
jgi:hypothetical protein